jgi:tetratricopeptide (TPR) repeat protein/transcriptional regulator with XRE-family HTH domain
VADGPAPGFGGLLRQLRSEAGLTQEELAEAASLSSRSISDLERGINVTARKETARLLAGALGLTGPRRAVFEAAARGRGPAVEAGNGPLGGAAAVMRMLPRDITGFTGRASELEALMAAFAGAESGGVVGIHAIGGMAGIGKTTLAVHAAHRLAPGFPDGQMFLPLHAHTPGQRPVDPADALASLLLAAGVDGRQIPPGLEERAAAWRDLLAGKKILLVLDDAAGHEQVRPLLPGAAGNMVLITSRRRLVALEDAAVISLDTLTPGEATALLARMSGRTELGLSTGPAREIARLCGYLPLAIGMLARQLRHHPAWTAADLAADLATARDRLEFMHAENLSVAAAFDLSYQDLGAGPRRLFRRLGLHPGPDIGAPAAAALHGASLATARRHLGVLYDQHLLTEPARGRFRLHDLLREHARALAAAEEPAVREAAAGRMLDYYLQTALAAGEHLPPWPLTGEPLPAGHPPGCAPTVATRRQAIAWLAAERANLHAAVGYAASSARPRHAALIPAAMFGFLGYLGNWDQAGELLQTGLAAARQAGDRPGQARALLLLSPLQTLSGDRAAGAASSQQALELYRGLGERAGQGSALNWTGMALFGSGDFPAAIACHQQALELFRDLGHRAGEREALGQLGGDHVVTGNYPAATAALRQALELSPGEIDTLSGLGAVQRLTGDYAAAASTFQQVLALCRDPGPNYVEGPNYLESFARIELGIVHRLTGAYPAAAACHQQALAEFRELSVRDGQAAALNELGLVQQLTGDYRAAADNHQQALALSRDVGDRYGQAVVLNSLGELSSRTGASRQARGHHVRALAIARDLGVPAEEARALEGIGRSHLQDGHPGQGTGQLRQALAIYQRIGVPDARRVQETLLSYRAGDTTPAAARDGESHQHSAGFRT